MKKRFISLCVSLIIVLTSIVSHAALPNSEGAFSTVSVDFPEGENMQWSERRKVALRYADTKEIIPLSHYYDNKVFATVPLENADREFEAFVGKETEFTDYDGYTYEFYNMKTLSIFNIINGDEEGRALPFSEITRAEAVKMLVKFMGISEEVNAKITFSDVALDAWYRPYVLAASKYGIIMGDSNEKFVPERNVTREEFVTMLGRALRRITDQFETEEITHEKLNEIRPYIDANDISDWALDSYAIAEYCAVYDIMETNELDAEGIPITVSKANPQKNALRHEAAEMIDRARERFQVYPSSDAIKFGFDKEMPVIDGSTSTYPFTQQVYSKLFLNGWKHPDMPKAHSKSHVSYEKLINGEIDMMFASVYPASDILELAKEKGVELELVPIAYDAMIFFTNKDNPIKGLTKEQISEIYVNNKYENWKELGGSDALLYPYCRNNDSGSHAQMERHFLNGNEINAQVQRETSRTMSDILTDVIASKTDSPVGYGLGYSIYYYYHNIDAVLGTKPHLKLLDIDGVTPTDETIADGTYPLSNNTYVVLRKDTPKDAPARKMAEFMLTQNGQECVEGAGFGRLLK